MLNTGPLTPEELLEIQKLALAIARKHGHADIAEDFAQDAVVQALATRQRNVTWMLFDFLRREYGAARTASGRAKSRARRFAVPLDAPASSDVDGPSLADTLGSPDPEPECLRGDWRTRVDLTGRAAVIHELVFEQEVPARDVAGMLGVTESRISQIIMAKVKPAVEAAKVIDDAADLYRDDPDYSKLVVDWIAI